MTFASPAYLLLLLLLVPLLLLKVLSDQRRARSVDTLVARRLSSRLVLNQDNATGWVLFLIELAALAFFIIALARPQLGYTESEVVGKGRDVMIAMDTSRSMLANDLQPNRFIRAKLAAQDLITSLPNDRIGLIAFAGRAFIQAPLTIDHDAVLETLNQFDTSIIPRGGTNLAEAIELSIQTFDKTDSANHALLLFTDGDDLEGEALETARRAREKNIMIITIGVGTTAGSFIPDPKARGGRLYLQDGQRQNVRTRLNREALESLARATRGLYLSLDSSGISDALIDKALENLETSKISGKDKQTPIERYRWPLAAGLILLIIAFVVSISGRGRRMAPAAALVAFTMLFATPEGALAENPYKAFARGDFETALQEFSGTAEGDASARKKNSEMAFGAGASAFRLGDFEMAIESFGEALVDARPELQEDAHYNLGNALAQKAKSREAEDLAGKIEDLESAIEHLDSALKISSSNTAAKFNRDALAKYLEELKKQQEQQQEDEQQKQEQPQEGEESEENEQQGEQDGEEGQGGDQDGEGQGGEQPQGEGQGGEQKGEGKDGEQQGNEGGGDKEKEEQQGDGGKTQQEAQQPKNEDLDGKLEAVNNGKPAEGEQKQGSKGGADQKKDPNTGFSRSEARSLLRSHADEDLSVRPFIDKAPPDGPYKDW